MRGRHRDAALRAVALTLLLAASVLAWSGAIGPPRVAAQEFDESGGIVPDSLFQEGPKARAYYQTQYIHDQSRGGWTQSLDYNRTWKKLAMNVSGSSGTSEDVFRLGSRSTNGDMLGMFNWRAANRLVVSMNGRFSMSSIADGVRASSSEQRRSNFLLQTQYHAPLFSKATFTLLGSSELQRNYDLRTSERTIAAPVGAPGSLNLQSDSSHVSGRLDAVRGQFRWPVVRGIEFEGKVYGSRSRPITTVRTFRSTQPFDGSAGFDSIDVRRIQLPADNALLDGTLTIDPFRATKLIFKSKRSGIDQVYFDLAQLQVEQYSNDGRFYSLQAQSVPFPGLAITSNATMNRTLREYVARPNLNALVISREASTGVAYSSPATEVFVNMIVNRTRAERQATGNGVTISRVLTTRFRQRVLGRLWLTGVGSATLYSYRYIFAPDPLNPARIYSVDDRDVAGAFGSVGARFAFTPRCSTAFNFSVSRTRNVSIDRLRSGGNIANTIYQLNGALRLPLHRNLSIGQDYVITATYRAFEFDEERDDLSRNFRIDTTVADTLCPFVYLRMDHRYFFFDQGDFSPIDAGGPDLYGVAQEQVQQILEGTIGIRPVRGVTLIVKQSLADTENRALVAKTRQGTDQWNLSLGLEVNRSFRNGAGITGSVRRESKYQNRSNAVRSLNQESYWLAGITFQKDF